MDWNLLLLAGYGWLLLCGWAKERGHFGPEFWIAAVSPIVVIVAFFLAFFFNIIGITADACLLLLYIYFLLPVPGMTWISQALGWRPDELVSQKKVKAVRPATGYAAQEAPVTSTDVNRAEQDQLVRTMAQAQQALERKDFLSAQKLFSQAQGMLPPEGPISEWPHLTKEEWRNDPERYITWPSQQRHGPTNHDVLLGLGVAAAGAGDLKTAERNIRQSRYYLISPDNLRERKSSLQRSGPRLKSYLESRHWEERKRTLPAYQGDWDRMLNMLGNEEISTLGQLDAHSLTEFLNRKRELLLGIRTDKAPTIEAEQLDLEFEHVWGNVETVEHEGDGHERRVTNCHLRWINPAALSLLGSLETCVEEGNVPRISKVFAFLDILYGFGRWAPGEFFDILYRLASASWKIGRYQLAVYFIKRVIRYEPPYLGAGLGRIREIVSQLRNRGWFEEAQAVLEDIEAWVPDQEGTADLRDRFPWWEKSKQEALCDEYKWLADKARERGRSDLMMVYKQRSEHARLQAVGQE